MKRYSNVFLLFIVIIFLFFFSVFLYKSFSTMIRVPFYEFDEAHRAETAKRMLEYKSFFVPLTGSPYDRVINDVVAPRIEFRDSPYLHLYYHLERPPLVYLFMIASVLLIEPYEFSYRLPSFILGMSTLFVYFFFVKTVGKRIHLVALFTGLLALITSSDLWLSSQYAQLDTGITFFLFISLLFLFLYTKSKKRMFLYCTGISYGLAILSKGQPAVIFVIPVVFLFFKKRLVFSDIKRIFLATLVTISPWLFYIAMYFNFGNFIKVFFGFAFISAAQVDVHQQAPFFWYIRWFWESFRPGWTLFLACAFLDILHRRVSWEKQMLLAYIFGSLFILSFPANKIWWYTLPLLPLMGIYIYLSLSDYIETSRVRILAVGLAIAIASLPISFGTTNTNTLLYGVVVTIVIVSILRYFAVSSLDKKMFYRSTNFWIFSYCLFFLSTMFGLYWFGARFPKVVPYDIRVRRVAKYFSTLPGQKCLWTKDMPLETMLFYSKAGEILILDKKSTFGKECKHYAITHEEYPGEYGLEFRNDKQIYKQDKIILYELRSD